MGAALAKSLLASGRSVTVWNRPDNKPQPFITCHLVYVTGQVNVASEQLEKAITAQESLRGTLDDAIIDMETACITDT
jgi:3-hydroxyisobutyrate dehydrogenase-like beta-hydroxyacid dehydrogenase